MERKNGLTQEAENILEQLYRLQVYVNPYTTFAQQSIFLREYLVELTDEVPAKVERLLGVMKSVIGKWYEYQIAYAELHEALVEVLED